MAGETLHEERSVLGAELLDRHRAISNLIEELEAIDWYDQRIKASDDEQLKQILAHNRAEEKEHASMLLEWLRRGDPEFTAHLQNYLFTSGPIREAEPNGADTEPAPAGDGSLGIGSLRGVAER